MAIKTLLHRCPDDNFTITQSIQEYEIFFLVQQRRPAWHQAKQQKPTDGPNDCNINKTLVIQKDIALKKIVGRYKDEIMSLVDSRPYAQRQTTITNFDNLTSSQ
ncbi:hypothetical protein GQX74_015554 [Glossina fuscipes]|nr:hypothetical protein GQX74_015554 [Glossina fuscipes]